MSEPGVEEPAPIKVCSACSVQSQTQGGFCPNCGKSFTAKGGVSKRTKLIAAGIVGAVLLAVAIGAGVTAKVHHDHQVQADQAAKAAADAKAAKVAAAKKAAAAAAKAKRVKEAAERRQRHTYVKQMERSISKDARKDVAEGTLQGPIYYTTCDPLGGGSTDDLTALTTTFSCIAVTKKNGDGTVSGYAYHATENWTKGSYSWQLGSG